MASFPGAKVHRHNRRKLGRGQVPSRPPVAVTASASTVTVTLTFSVPVVVSQNIDLHLSPSHTLLTQVQNDGVTVTQTYDASVVGSTWTIDAGTPGIATFQGGGVAAATGTF